VTARPWRAIADAAPAVRLVQLVAAMLVVVLSVMACGPAPADTATPQASPPVASAPTTPAPTLGPTDPPGPSATPASPGSGVVEDLSLLSLVPADVAGVPVRPETVAYAEAASDPAFAANVEAAAFFVAVDASDLASGVVAQLRPGVFSEGFFRDWRDSYNEGACAQAGGVAGNAEAELGGRTVYITSCAGGLLAYHAHVEDRGVIVSLISVGERRFGEQLMKGIGA
jgi:hypothetical protein